MGLVDYDSDGSGSSDGEAPVAALAPKATTTTMAGGKKPFQKLVDRANPGKILVNLPTAAASDTKAEDDDFRPAKRAKVGAASSSRFSGFGSFLPPPKNPNTSAAKTVTSKLEGSSSAASSATSRPGINLKTSSEAAFSRRDTSANDSTAQPATTGDDNKPKLPSSSSSSSFASKMALPPPKAPSIPQDQKAAEDVKLVGNPLMFMPLSVSRKPGAKKRVAGASSIANTSATNQPAASAVVAPLPKKKVSLFSLGADDLAETEQATAAAQKAVDEEEEDNRAEASSAAAADYTSTYKAAPPAGYGYDAQQGYSYGENAAAADTSSLNTIANDMHLSAKERRELFGRTGAASASAKISATFNMDQEYQNNEALRNSEEGAAQQQSHNPVRTLMPGKHTLRQLVTAVHSQQEALEENFVKNRQSQRDAGSRYGWR